MDVRIFEKTEESTAFTIRRINEEKGRLSKCYLLVHYFEDVVPRLAEETDIILYLHKTKCYSSKIMLSTLIKKNWVVRQEIIKKQYTSISILK